MAIIQIFHLNLTAFLVHKQNTLPVNINNIVCNFAELSHKYLHIEHLLFIYVTVCSGGDLEYNILSEPLNIIRSKKKKRRDFCLQSLKIFAQGENRLKSQSPRQQLLALFAATT